jgi:hypothetical protein
MVAHPSRWRRLFFGIIVVTPCVYGMLVAVGLLEFGDLVGRAGAPAMLLLVAPLGAALLLLLAGAWEERVLPALGEVLKRLWPRYDAPPGPLMIGHVAWIVLLGAAVVGAVFLLLR